jgi:hypothetical protein
VASCPALCLHHNDVEVNVNLIMPKPSVGVVRPKEPELFRKVAEVVKIGLEYLPRIKKIRGDHLDSYREWHEFSVLDNGMPSLTLNTLDAPIDYKQIFNTFWLTLLGENSDEFDLSKSPSFETLLSYLAERPELRVHFFAGNADQADPDARGMLATSVLLWVEYQIDRFLHLYPEAQFTEEEFFQVYTPMEVCLTDKRLAVDVCVPILLAKFEVDNMELEERAHIFSMNESFQLARASLRTYGPGVHESVMAASTHALRLRGYLVSNEDYYASEISGNASAYPLRDIDTFFAALRIATSVDTGYAQLILSPWDWARSYKAHLPYVEGTSIRKYPYWFEDFYWNKPVPTISATETRRIAELFAKLRVAFNEPQGNKLLLATQRLNSCFLRENEEDTILDATIAMELLLSDDEGTEVTHKLAMRMAALATLAKNFPDNPLTVFRNVKQVYGFRSGVVHGDSRKANKKREIIIEEQQKIPTVKVAINYIRMALGVLLEHPEYLVASLIDERLLLRGTASPTVNET